MPPLRFLMTSTPYLTSEFIKEGSTYSGLPSMAIPRAMEGLHGICPPPFLNKTYDLIDDPNTNHIVAWSKGNNSFIVWDPETFSIQLLPKYFKHSNLSSFIRQLNTYGFRKVDPDKLEFANEWFLRGQMHLLKNIKRRKTPSHPQSSHQDFDSCVEVGQFGLDSEIDRLRRDRQVLMVELVKLRQEQQNTRAHLKSMEHRLKGTEMKQHQIMGLLARMIQNPSFVKQLVKHDRRKEFVEAISNKRRKAIDQGLNNAEVREFGQGGEGGNYAKLEPQDYSDVSGFEVSEKKTTNMQNPTENFKEKEERQDGGHKSLDKGFWEELLDDGIEEDMALFGIEAEGEEVEVDMLVEQLGFMDSSPR